MNNREEKQRIRNISIYDANVTEIRNLQKRKQDGGF